MFSGRFPPYHKMGIAVALITIVAFSIILSHDVVFEAPVAVIDLDQSRWSAELIEKLNASPYIQVERVVHSPADPRRMTAHDRVQAVIFIPKDAQASLLRGAQTVRLGTYLDDSNTAQNGELISQLNKITAELSAERAASRPGGVSALGQTTAGTEALLSPLRMGFRYLANPTGQGATGTVINFLLFFSLMFHGLTSLMIIGRLRVALEEGHIQAEDAALSRIARAAEGGMRDAWSIMDMCLSYAQEEDGGLTEALVLRVLGAADKSFLFAFADRLIDSDAAGALALIDEMMRKGREVQVFVRDVSAHLRALMLADICGEEQLSGLLEVTREDAAEYVAQAKRTSHTRLMRMLDLFLASETDMKWAAQPRFALETAALRACAPEESMQVEALVARVDELERKLREGVVAAAPARKQAAAAQAADTPDDAQGEAAPPPAKEAPKGPAPDAERIWQEAMRQAKQKPQLFGMLKFGRLVSGENGLFTVVYPKAMGAAYVKMLSIPEKNEEVAGYLTQAAGYPCTFRAAIEGTVQESDKAILSAQEEARKQAENSLNKVFDMFGRENVRVKDE